MGRRISRKLRSSKGASLTFALLAFLVCAVISAVLLASAAAATGRLSNLAETDQRYYAVTSVVQLFCDELEGQEFTIVREETSYQVNVRAYFTSNGITYSRPASEDEITTWFGSDVLDKKQHSYVYSLSATGLEGAITDKGLPADETSTSGYINDIRNSSLLANAALSYVIGANPDGSVSCPVSKAYGKKPGQSFTVAGSTDPVDEIELGEFHLGYEKSGAATVEGPAVTVVAKLRKDGSIILEASNIVPESDTEKKIYTVTVTLMAEVTDDSDLPIATSSDSYAFRFDPYNALSYESTVTTTEKTKTTTIKWNVTDIRKGAA